MGYSNGKISKPVNINDIARCLGENSRSIGTLCRSEKINKWSKHKPVNRSIFTPLTEEEFMGTDTGQTYGLVIPSVLQQIQDILDMDFEYDRPTGTLASPFRTRDFDGYDHYAQPIIIGSLIDASFVDNDETISVSINVDYLLNNTTGVDLGSVILNRPATPEESVEALSAMYPCIIVKNLSNGRIYTKALQYRNTLEYGTLKSASNAWETDFMCSFKDVEGLEPSGLSSEYKVSFYLITDINRAPQGLYDLREWQDMTTELGFVLVDRYVPIPGLTAMTLILRKHQSGYVGVFLDNEDIYVNSQDTPITLTVRANPKPDEPIQATVKMETASKSIFLYPDIDSIVTFTLRELQLAYTPMPEPIEVRASITIPRNSSEDNVVTKTFKLHFV